VPRSLLALLAALAVCLLGAAPSLVGTPAVVVFPMQANDSSIDREASSRIATTIAQRIADGGGVKVLPPNPSAERKDYLEEARRAGADYYVTGFLAGLGSGVTMILQVVSAQTGIVAFSNSAQVDTYADAANQGDIVRAAILRHAGRNLAAYESLPTPPPQGPSPVPSGGSDADLTKLLGRKKAPVAVAAAAPAAAVATGPLALLPITGTADGERREGTRKAIALDLDRGGVHPVVLTPDQPPAAACTAAGNAAGVLGGTLDVRTESAVFGRSTTATLRLIQHDCAGNIVYDQTIARSVSASQGADAAVQRVADAAVGEYLHPTPKKR
jgi:hypothetical protein